MTPEPWEPPIPFRDANLPEFPTSHLPATLRAIVEGVAESVQIAADVPALAAFGAVSAVVAGKFVVRLRSDRVEPVNFWTATVLPSGERKSAAFSLIVAPVSDWEHDECLRRAPLDEQQRQRIATMDAQLARAVKTAAGGGEAARAAAVERDGLAQERAGLRVPEPFQLLFGDATPEAVGVALAGQGGRAAIVTDEAAGLFDVIRGRYSKDGRANVDVYLQGFSGSPVRVNRTGRPPLHVPRPCLTIATTMQPCVLTDVGSDRELIDRGLLPRFMWGLPSSLVGYRSAQPTPLPGPVSEAYGDVLGRLCHLPEARDESGHFVAAEIGIDTDAQRILRDLGADVEIGMRPGGRFEHVREWANRIEGNASRLSGLLECWQAAEDAEAWDDDVRPRIVKVSALAADRAARLMREYFIPHGLAAFGRMGANPALAGAQRLLGWIQRKGLAQFSRTEAHQGNESWAERAADLDAPLRVLEERNYIRPTPEPDAAPSEKGGRPRSPRFDVNPAALQPAGENRGNRENPEGAEVPSVPSVPPQSSKRSGEDGR